MLWLLLLVSVGLWGQTQGTPSQIKGTGAPAGASCTANNIGQEYFQTDATAGQNIYRCTSAGVWTLFAGGSGGGGLSLLEIKTASSSASLDFTSCISSSYGVYQFEFVGVRPATNNVLAYMRVSTDGGASWLSTAIYAHTTLLWRASTSGAGGATDAQLNLVFNNVSNDANFAGITGTLKLYNPTSTTTRKAVTGQFSYFGENATHFLGSVLSGSINNISAINAVQFYFGVGNIASGTIYCYGYPNS